MKKLSKPFIAIIYVLLMLIIIGIVPVAQIGIAFLAGVYMEEVVDLIYWSKMNN